MTLTPYYQDDAVTLYHGDCRENDAWLTADVLVTDPPYGRAWRQGDINTARGWARNDHDGILNDADTSVRDAALALWGERPAMVFGDLMLPAPIGTRHVLIYDKGVSAGMRGALGGYRRNAEAVYLLGRWPSGIGGKSAIIATRTSTGGNLARQTGHPHTKPLDVMEGLVEGCPPGTIADPFAGTGATLIAARNLGHKVIGVEMEERYCETAARRLSQSAFTFEVTGA